MLTVISISQCRSRNLDIYIYIYIRVSCTYAHIVALKDPQSNRTCLNELNAQFNGEFGEANHRCRLSRGSN